MALMGAETTHGEYTVLKYRRGTAAEWTAANPILRHGETGYETDTKRSKVGDGVTVYNTLKFTDQPLATGAAPRCGEATLAAGTVTVATTAVTATSLIFATGHLDGGGTEGNIRVSARTPGTSFVITSSEATDTSKVAWMIVDPG
jgi:hypothetical protein